jgi:peptidyl-prolyl cis-trans isomerase SurA
VRNIVGALDVGQASQPIVQKNGVGVIMVCEKAVPNTALPTRDEIANQLARQRAENLARRYLRDLRRTAFVDVRV